MGLEVYKITVPLHFKNRSMGFLNEILMPPNWTDHQPLMSLQSFRATLIQSSFMLIPDITLILSDTFPLLKVQELVIC